MSNFKVGDLVRSNGKYESMDNMKSGTYMIESPYVDYDSVDYVLKDQPGTFSADGLELVEPAKHFYKVGDRVKSIGRVAYCIAPETRGIIKAVMGDIYEVDFERTEPSVFVHHNQVELYMPDNDKTNYIQDEILKETVKNINRSLDEGSRDKHPDVFGKKLDSGKAQISQIPFQALEEVAKVLMFGAQKYGRSNWKKGIAYTKYYDAAMRHLGAFQSGVDNDHESNESHIAHAAANCLMLLWTIKNKSEMDDRNE